jgi:anaerobic ribonucleoside-triphosphate reductase activating protein
MLVSRLHFPVTALGWGRRVGIWTQGCGIGCRGCMAQDTWPADSTHDVPVSEILRVVTECLPVDGVTISGGEPLDQATELAQLLTGLRNVLGSGNDILCYSGRSRQAVQSRFGEILGLVDAIVVGPYDQDRALDDPLRGSSNQDVLPCTPLGAARYGPTAGDQNHSSRRSIQVSLDDGHVRTIGVPAPGELTALEAATAAAGLRIVDASWRTGRTGRA